MTSAALLDLVTAAIRDGGTDAEDRVFRTGDWPTQQDQYPILKLRVASESRISLGRGFPCWTVTTTIQVIAEASEVALPRGGGAEEAERKLWILKDQLEAAVINSSPLFQQIQQLASTTAQLAYTSEAEQHLAGLDVRLAFEFYQDAGDFAPIEADDVDEVDVALVSPAASITIQTT